ncbi:MAG: alpha/beta hydrolase family protein, partial [Nitrospinota bacterium]
REALPLLQPPGRRIEVPFEGTSLPGILRLPPGGAGGEGAPCVLLLAGLDSTKEEFHTFEPLFHARGLATFAFDGPGQGERGDLPLRADFETAVGAVAEFLGREGLDGGGRLGALGVSTGGYYAARAAARVPRLRATVAVGGFYDLAGCWEGLPRLTRQGFAHAMGGVSEEEARERGEALSLQGVLGALRTPLLIVHGEGDRICPPAEARRMAEEARRSGAEVELRLYPEGNHVCNNLPHLYRPLAADWLGERLRAAPHHMV